MAKKTDKTIPSTDQEKRFPAELFIGVEDIDTQDEFLVTFKEANECDDGAIVGIYRRVEVVRVNKTSSIDLEPV